MSCLISIYCILILSYLSLIVLLLLIFFSFLMSSSTSPKRFKLSSHSLPSPPISIAATNSSSSLNEFTAWLQSYHLPHLNTLFSIQPSTISSSSYLSPSTSPVPSPSSPTCFGLFLLKDVSPQGEIAEIPLNLVFSSSNALKSPLCKYLKNLLSIFSSLPPEAFLLVFMIFSKHSPPLPISSSTINSNDSFNIVDFGPYFRSLPSSYPEIPLCWSSNHLKFLKNTNLYMSVLKKKKMLMEEFKTIEEVLREDRDGGDDNNIREDKLLLLEKFTFNEYLWAYNTLHSRGFPTFFDKAAGGEGEGGQIGVLLPLLDIMNHCYKSKIQWKFDQFNNKIIFINDEAHSLSIGEVWNNYGGKSNEEFLFSYGFTCTNEDINNTNYTHNLLYDPLYNEDEYLLQLSFASFYTNFSFQIKFFLYHQLPPFYFYFRHFNASSSSLANHNEIFLNMMKIVCLTPHHFSNYSHYNYNNSPFLLHFPINNKSNNSDCPLYYTKQVLMTIISLLTTRFYSLSLSLSLSSFPPILNTSSLLTLLTGFQGGQDGENKKNALKYRYGQVSICWETIKFYQNQLENIIFNENKQNNKDKQDDHYYLITPRPLSLHTNVNTNDLISIPLSQTLSLYTLSSPTPSNHFYHLFKRIDGLNPWGDDDEEMMIILLGIIFEWRVRGRCSMYWEFFLEIEKLEGIMMVDEVLGGEEDVFPLFSPFFSEIKYFYKDHLPSLYFSLFPSLSLLFPKHFPSEIFTLPTWKQAFYILMRYSTQLIINNNSNNTSNSSKVRVMVPLRDGRAPRLMGEGEGKSYWNVRDEREEKEDKEEGDEEEGKINYCDLDKVHVKFTPYLPLLPISPSSSSFNEDLFTYSLPSFSLSSALFHHSLYLPSRYEIQFQYILTFLSPIFPSKDGDLHILFIYQNLFNSREIDGNPFFYVSIEGISTNLNVILMEMVKAFVMTKEQLIVYKRKFYQNITINNVTKVIGKTQKIIQKKQEIQEEGKLKNGEEGEAEIGLSESFKNIYNEFIEEYLNIKNEEGLDETLISMEVLKKIERKSILICIELFKHLLDIHENCKEKGKTKLFKNQISKEFYKIYHESSCKLLQKQIENYQLFIHT